jgi:hypothetical protein
MIQKLLRALGVLLVLGAVAVYARDCRLSVNRWNHCGGDPGQPGIVGDWAHFEWTPAGIFNDVLYIDGKPAARLVKYYFHMSEDAIEIVSLDGTKRSRYCGK